MHILSLIFAALATGSLCADVQPTNKIRVACIGDSITYGYAMTNALHESYPVQLQKLLGDRYEVKTFAQPGSGAYAEWKKGDLASWDVPWRLSKCASPAYAFEPDIVVSGLGINDSAAYMWEFQHDATGKTRTPEGTFRKDYIALLNAFARPGRPRPRYIMWTRLGPIGKNHREKGKPHPFLMEPVLREVAEAVGAEQLDMYTPLLPFAETEHFAKDGVHPEGGAQRVIAEVTARRILAKPQRLSFPAEIPPVHALERPDDARSPETRRHVGIPSVCVSPKTGRFWATWYAGPTAGEDANNYCVLATSADGGKTWREVLLADPDGIGPVRAFDPNVWIAPSGALAWTWTERTCPLASGETGYAGTDADPRNDRLMMALLDAELEPEVPIVPRAIGRGVMMNKPTFLANGDWLLPVSHWYEAPSARFLRSRDGGWTFAETRGGVTLPDGLRTFDEHQAVERRDGTLVCYMRTKGDDICSSESADGGETWSVPKPTGLGHPSSRFFVSRLRSGAWLLVKHGRIGEKLEERRDLRAFVSDDEGKSWLGGLMLDERAGVSYPDGCQLADGRIAVSYDFDRMGARRIHLATFSEAAARAGRDEDGSVRLHGVVSRPAEDCGAELASGDLHAADLTPLKSARDVAGEPIVLVRNGKAMMPVVVLDEGGNGRAAEYLADTVFEMTGVKPEVLHEKKGKPVAVAPALHVGNVKAASDAGLAAPDDHPEAFRVVSKNGSVYFLGRGDYGVYDWCERVLDVRFYWPERPKDMYGEKSEAPVYGKCVRKTRGLAVRPVDYDDRPVFACRRNWPYEQTPWCLASKNGNSCRAQVNVHAPYSWWKEPDATNHIEVFARTEDGQRLASPLLCYGNPKSLEYYKRRIEEHIAGTRDSALVVGKDKVITVSQWDCLAYCSCEHCRKLYDPKLGASGSGSPIIWGYFTKELAKWLKETHPDYVIAILPYLNTCDVPPGVDFRAEGNVYAQLCTMPGLAMLKNDACRRDEQRLIRQWAEATGNPVLAWHYSCWPGEFTAAPYVFGETIARHYREMRDSMVGTFINGRYDVPRISLSAYVWMRCLWNPDTDVQALYDGFAQRMFGNAAHPMRRLIAMQENGWNRPWGSNQCSMKNIYAVSYPRADVLRMQALFADAERYAAGDEKALARIAWYKSGFGKFFRESAKYAEGAAFPPFVMKKGLQPKIDGRLDDACWERAPAHPFVAARDPTNTVPWAATAAKAVWDDRGVTFGFLCSEPAIGKMDYSKVKGNLAEQDSIELILDCSGKDEGHRYQLIIDINNRVNIYTDGARWEPKGIKTAIATQKDSWSLEVYIPYSDLKDFLHVQIPTTSANGCRWGGNLIRLRVCDALRPASERVAGSRMESSRLSTRFNKWNWDQSAYSEFVFAE